MGPVKLSRCMYAQLKQQQFQPPSVFGRLPSPKSPEYNAHMLGVKLACGFEILMSKVPHVDLSNLDGHEGFKHFLKNLNHHGFFGESIPGSKDYREKMTEAKHSFLEAFNSLQHMNGQTAEEIVNEHISRDEMLDSIAPVPRQRNNTTHQSGPSPNVDKRLCVSWLQIHALCLKRFMEQNPPSGYKYETPHNIREDGEDWLNISPTDLDRLLSAYQFMTTEKLQTQTQQGDNSKGRDLFNDSASFPSLESAKYIKEGHQNSKTAESVSEPSLTEDQVHDKLNSMADSISKFIDMPSDYKGAVDLESFFMDEDMRELDEDDSDIDEDTSDEESEPPYPKCQQHETATQSVHIPHSETITPIQFESEGFLKHLRGRLHTGFQPSSSYNDIQKRDEEPQYAEEKEDLVDDFSDIHEQIEHELKGSSVKHGYVKVVILHYYYFCL